MPDSADLFFWLSKVFAFFTQPTNLLLFAGVAGIVLMPTRFAPAGRRLAVAALILLAVVAWSPIGRVAIVFLEQRFPPWSASAESPAGIIILGGSINIRLSEARHAVVLSESAERLTVGVELARRYPHARLIFSGGSASLALPDVKEAWIARRLLEDLGIPSERIEIEDRSRNTVENAVFSKQIANPKPGERWLLVTSAFHMPRSVGAFRRAGFAVDAHPVDWLTAGPQDMRSLSDTASSSFRRFDVAVHEWIGLVVYWLSGRTSELFPGPSRQGCDLAEGKDGCRPER